MTRRTFLKTLYGTAIVLSAIRVGFSSDVVLEWHFRHVILDQLPINPHSQGARMLNLFHEHGLLSDHSPETQQLEATLKLLQ